MKIQVLAPGFAGFGGGIAAYSRNLAVALRAIGHDLSLVGKVDADGYWDGIPLSGAGSWPRRGRSVGFVAKGAATFISGRPDLIISTHVNYGLLTRVLSGFSNSPYVIVAHGVEMNRQLSRFRRLGLLGARRVWAVSGWTKGLVEGRYPSLMNHVDVLPNTFDESRFSPANKPVALIDRYGLQSGERVIVTVGRLDPSERYKGCDRILKALPAVVQACGPVRCIVVGGGDDGERIRAIASEAGVERLVTFAGFVPDVELADHYRLADAFAMPSTGEGFGIVYLEAMACGTPVLGGNIDGSVDALDQGRLGLLVDPLDIAEIARGMVALLLREGPATWFDRAALSQEVRRTFGARAFQSRLRDILSV